MSIDIPAAWFNVVPQLPTPLQPPLHPGTRQPVGPDDLAPLFPMALIGQEVSAEPWIDVPGEVLDVLRLWRPTPLVRARRLEHALGTPARVYFKDESVSPAGSPKPNTAVHQTVIGLEAKDQLGLAGEERPDVVIGCCGGGSNLGGIALPFVPDGGVRLVAVEPSSCPTLTGGRFDYDFGDTAEMTPLLPMYTLGHEFIPPAIHAGGLRYHGDSPIISNLVREGRMEAMAYPQGKVFEAAVQWARTQGTIAAPETAHAIRAVLDEALAAKEEGQAKVILFNYSGHGLLDLGAYDDYLHDRLDA